MAVPPRIHPRLRLHPRSCTRHSMVLALASSMLQHLPTSQQKNLVVQEAFLCRFPLDIRRIVEQDETLNLWELAKRADKQLKGRVNPPLVTLDGPDITAVSGNRPEVKLPTSKKTGPKSWCWFHRRHGDNATKCDRECSWPNFPIAVLNSEN